MKVSGYVTLTGEFDALELDEFPSPETRRLFDEWLLENEWALPYAHIGNYYEPGICGDITYPAIMITKDCPPSTLTMIRLKWS